MKKVTLTEKGLRIKPSLKDAELKLRIRDNLAYVYCGGVLALNFREDLITTYLNVQAEDEDNAETSA